ncbi:MAG: EAL domain-containing protein [Nitrosomonadales bacterium]|nr:EAL domain-containing protein [Nitrosomonadales bacterium]
MSPIRLLLVLAVTVFTTEALVMFALDFLLPPMPALYANSLDAALLVTLVFPVFYLQVFRPMQRNIRELSELEQARRANEASLRAMMDNSPYRVWLKDTAGRFLAVNGQFAKACGMATPEELIGKTNRDILSEEQAEKYSAEELVVMTLHKQKYSEEYVLDHGKARWFGTFRTPIIEGAGKIIGTTGFSRDITERKDAEAQLRLTAKIFESSHDAITITDIEGTIISINPAFSRITGYSAEEVVGRNPRILNSGKQGKEFYVEMWRCILQNGYWSGEVWNRGKDGGAYAGRLTISALRDETDKVTHYIGVTSDITEYKTAQERIRNLAYFDQLTDLPNRSLLRDRVNQLILASQRDKRGFAVVFIDLDNFKNVNDSLGHYAGDQLLQMVAIRLRDSVREMDTVSRLGGDEFVVVLPEVSIEDAHQVARKIIGQVASSYLIKERYMTVTASLGISMYPADAQDLDSLLKHADTALYRAKGKGKNDYVFFTEEMNAAAYERMRLENDLRRALLNEELLLYYQPQIDLASGKMIGMEALLRWPHRELGMIPPDRFIPIAEESGLIIELGEWVMHEACRQNRQWQLAGLPAIPVSVNVSAQQLKNNSLFDTVERVLRHTRLDARYLELELTEHAVMDEVQASIEMMKKVCAIGVKFSIDDFGTGYSSFSHLKYLPLNMVKIDQSFVRDMPSKSDDREIASAIIQLAHSLRLKVVAEGVETSAQMEILLEQGCDSAQGYFFSKPLPTQELEVFLRAAQTV